MDEKIQITCLYTPQLHYAMQQNGFPVIRSVQLHNSTDAPMDGILVRIRFSPAFAGDWCSPALTLPPGRTVEVRPEGIGADPGYLCSMTEKVAGQFTITAEAGEEVLAETVLPLELLPCDQWTGTLTTPELTAAYITPNLPQLVPVTARAGQFLQAWNGDPAFTAYQTQDPSRVRRQMAALYAALQAENIAYTVPPASFEASGQRLRLPHTVLEQKSGTCLDLALLYAACAEAVGLFPLIVFTEGHAFAGCWLEEETFADCTVDDVTALTKRTASGIDSICLVECTDFTAGKAVDFENAEAHARAHLDDADAFRMVLDVRRCRASGIRPVPVRVQENGTFRMIDYGQREESDLSAMPEDLSSIGRPQEAKAAPVTRLELWERKLLDLSLRNSLLNFRPGASSLQLMTSTLSVLEDGIARGEAFRIGAVPQELHPVMNDSRIFDIESGREQAAAFAAEELGSHRLRTFLTDAALEQILKKLHRQARVSLEENGANTLFLALGFLRWYETDKSVRPRYAPLVLVPVDLIRRIQDKCYALRVRDEEVQMNITLLEMLRQDHGIRIDGLDPLPQDESGVDLPLVFNTVRQAVLSKPHWDIEELAFLGQFSFSQFIMWNDMRNRADELRENPLVASLMEGALTFDPVTAQLSPTELDNKVSPSDMAVPTSADSSQLAAIYAASQGESFVLHGPPGTGKSQTITNMIANALYNGKSVLFVAEKMAALSVVQKRLEKLGLGPFCLELHSNKAHKRQVLTQLEQALSVGHVKHPETYEQTAAAIRERREEMGAMMAALHEPAPIGMSLYEAIALYDTLSLCKGRFTLGDDYAGTVSREDDQAVLSLIERIRAAGHELGGLTASPLRHYCRSDYTMELREHFRQDCVQYQSALRSAHASLSPLGLAACSYEEFITGAAYLKAVQEGAVLTGQLCGKSVLDERGTLDALLSDLRRVQEVRGSLLSRFEPTVMQVDGNAALLAWKRNEQKWALPRAFGRKSLIKELAVHAKAPGTVTQETYPLICAQLQELTALQSRIGGTDGSVTGALAPHWKGADTSADALASVLDRTAALRTRLAALPDKGASLTAKLSGAADAAAAFRAVQSLEVMHAALRQTYCVDLDALFARSQDWYTTAEEAASGWISGVSLLRERSVLESLLRELADRGLGAAVQAFREGRVDEDSLRDAYRCETARTVIARSFAQNPALSRFQGAQFEVALGQYRSAAKEFEALTVQELIARLSAGIPSSAQVRAGNSEIAILQRAIKSGGRMLSIRSLFDQIPTLLRRLCPCMLMSPISVAQYIDPAFPKFDLVVFDEASQLPTSEAVGAIARGAHAVIVGDPKQLPPTSFFTSQHTDEEHYDKEDLESVLDDCLALSMPQKHLLWHYRSRHESLIAFSNARFYDNKLLTFPSPDDLQRRVVRIPVEGCYDKSRTRQNRAEAEAVVAEIVRRLRDETLRQESIGVVTFSVAQQNLIDDLLAEAYVREPELETWANAMYEPIFIKNLENVQGDERDVILFSIGYGPDKDGKVSMNFGPINQDGGWRRLNVAVSRARKGMQVYSVIRPDQIDLSRTRAEGVAQLRAFLEFAERGQQALIRQAGADSYQEDSFARLIADALQAHGYDVRCGVGCSGFRIDAAVVHPEDPERFVLGILCDSAASYRTSTSRDRNISQPSVLRGLGWQICHVHILDWLDNKERTVEKLLRAVENALHPQKEEETVPPARGEVYSSAQFEHEEVLTPLQQCVPYTVCEPLGVMGKSEDFAGPAARKKIASCITHVLEAQAPVSRRTVCRTVAAAWGITRVTAKVEESFGAVLQTMGVPVTASHDTEFLWKPGQDPETYDICRVGPDGEKRALEEICAEELCMGMLYILRSQFSMPRSELVRAVGALFGHTRLGAAGQSAVTSAIVLARHRGLIRFEEDRVIAEEGA
ncbi:MAG: DUF3320 domain-containing protein [Oscillospiraceae bacterium]|nr:DUF3320 domain-containing protein [Oscillospiraceae bacterium]